MKDTFKIVRVNRMIQNKKNDYSLSLRLHKLNTNDFCNASMYIPKDKKNLLNFIYTLKQGDIVDILYEPAKNKKYASNIDAKHILKIK